jgi:hypothetical protein
MCAMDFEMFTGEVIYYDGRTFVNVMLCKPIAS